jgi:hypothetical protein
VVNIKDSEQLMRNLVTLVRNSRTFIHRNRPLYWAEVRRLRRLGRRWLTRIYGNTSSETEAFGQLTAQAFSFLPTRSGHVHKVEVIEGTEGVFVGEEDDRVYHLNKLDLINALQILLEAAHQLRNDLGARGENIPRRPSRTGTESGSQMSPKGAAADGPNERRTQVQEFLAHCNQELPFKVLKRHIWTAGKYKSARQFQHWQANSKHATLQDKSTFPRILAMSPHDFHSRLVSFKVRGVPAVEKR